MLPEFDEHEEPKYRSFVGPADKFDLISAAQFNLLISLDLREDHFLLDIGCGSLSGGRLFIPYLLSGHYYGIEPEQWLVKEGIRNELGEDVIRAKSPVFSDNKVFTLSVFHRKFDYLLAHSIFSHAPEWQIRRCLSEAAKVMEPSSIFVATFAKGDENYLGSQWVYPGFVTYTLDRMKGLVEEQGMICRPLELPHPTFQTWLLIINPSNGELSHDESVAKLSNIENKVKVYEKGVAHLRIQTLELFLSKI